PVLGEEGVRPALVIQPSPAASAIAPFSQDAPKTAAYPAIEGAEMPSPMVLEGLEPASQSSVERLNDRLERLPVRPLRLRTNRVLELRYAFLPRPVFRPSEVIAQEVKAVGPGVDHLRLRR